MIFDRSTQYQAYNIATQTVPKTRQIVMLYDGAIRFMQQAKDAIAEKRIEDRFNLLVRAGEIVVSLQNSLDHENGGEIARILHDYYSSIDMRILSIHRTCSLETCDRVIAELKEMRNAWHQIDSTPAQAVKINAATMPVEINEVTPASPTATINSSESKGSLQVSA
jgi:flagellar protein FliS